MHKTQAFKTCDGQLFDNEAEAARHEATIKIRNWADRRHIGTNGSITWDSVAKAMIEDADELAYLFISLARSLPRNGGPAFVDEIVPMNGGNGTMWLYKNADAIRVAGEG
jgi:hypothetical protein